MKALLILLAMAAPLSAQVILPTTGKKFDTRTINGSGGSGGVSINSATKPPPPTKTKLTSYFMLGEPRQWKSTDGKSLLGTIITFEESVLEFDAANPAAAREAAQKAPPAKMPASKDARQYVEHRRLRALICNASAHPLRCRRSCAEQGIGCRFPCSAAYPLRSARTISRTGVLLCHLNHLASFFLKPAPQPA